MKPITLKELFDHPSRWIKGAVRGRRGGMGFVKTGVSPEEANCFCLVGGMAYVLDRNSGYSEMRGKIQTAICKLFPNRGKDHIDFNNHPDTTFTDLRRVIEEANV